MSTSSKIPNLSPAAGWIKDPEALAKLSGIGFEEVTIGSFALDARAGNSGDTYYWSELDDTVERMGSACSSIHINSIGIPSPDFDWLCEHFSEFVEAAGQATLRISISPFGQADLAKMVLQLTVLANKHEADIIIEVNLGCPNVWDDVGQKTLTSYDIELVDAALREVVWGRGDNTVRIAIKFSPQFDPYHVGKLVDVCDAAHIYEVVLVNTVPNTTLFNLDTEKTVIDAVPEGSQQHIVLGGQSGMSILPIAIGNILMFKQAIAARKSPLLIKGVGGISDAWSLRQHVLAGADSFAVGSHAMNSGAKVFSEIISDYLTEFG